MKFSILAVLSVAAVAVAKPVPDTRSDCTCPIQPKACGCVIPQSVVLAELQTNLFLISLVQPCATISSWPGVG
ncbi:uncharacterized protein LMH87_009090 [Akanthomyces muscarius]|uniref:Hydrophobin n=1 Tax=Akanthomyces muscarius TaxID=2231603 RepID=A0A9W8UQB4_AKAMU|nr:uncharacterized protein LMH87_009090 [Akanthomyces muscarius]KAJ4158571.1 hypothetical protein LMH87_009090 [Akanthomyces muscarius]